MNVTTTILLLPSFLSFQVVAHKKWTHFEQTTRLKKKENKLNELGLWLVVIRQPRKSYGGIVKVKP